MNNEEKLREEFVDGELTDDFVEYVRDTSEYVAEVVRNEMYDIVNECKNIKELKDLKNAVLEYKEEKI